MHRNALSATNMGVEELEHVLISGRCAFYDCYAIKHVLPVYEGVKPGSGDF